MNVCCTWCARPTWDCGTGTSCTNRVYYSREWKAQVGYDEHEIGDGYEEWASRVHPEDLDRMVRAVRATIEHRAEFAQEFRFRHRDGSWRVIFAQASLEAAEDGRPVRMLGSHIDLTDLRSTEAAYRQTQEFLSLAYESAGLGTCYHDVPAGTVRFDDRGRRHYGFDSPDASIEEVIARVHPDDVDRFRRELGCALGPGSNGFFTTEYRVVHPGGEVRWLAVRVQVRFDGEGPDARPSIAFGTTQDVTDVRRRGEEHRKLATAVEQAAEAIVITDPSANIVYVNPAFERISGYTRAEAMGQNPRILKSGQHEQAFYDEMWNTLRQGESWSGILVNRRKDGAFYYEEATISPVHDDSGAVVNYVAVKRDVTYERKVEEQLRQSQKLEAIGQLAGGIAHDFNNILSIIKGHAEMVEVTRDLPADVRTSVDEINRAADRAAGLTRQLLLFSRRQALQLSTVDLNDVVVNMSRMLARILGEDIRVQFEYASRALTINADAGMIDQVLLNLAVNSRDAMPAGGRLTVALSECELDESTAAVHPGARPGAYACLTVSDTGDGIAPDVLPRVFEPFYTTKEVGKGTGLGLATVLGIVQQHGGWVDVQSEFGHGTVVRVYLPRAEQELARTRSSDQCRPPCPAAKTRSSWPRTMSRCGGWCARS